MPNPISISALKDKYEIMKEILDDSDMRTDIIHMYGLSVGGLCRWEASLDLLVLPKHGKKLISTDYENCNKELSNLLDAQVSTFTEELIKNNEKRGAIEAGTFNSIKKEIIVLDDLLKFNELFVSIKKQDINVFQQNVEMLFNNEPYINKLLPSDLGNVTLLHYAIEHFSKPIIDFILNNNPDITIKDFKGLTVIQRLVKKIVKEFNLKKVLDKNKVEYLNIFLEKKGATLAARDVASINKILASNSLSLIQEKPMRLEEENDEVSKVEQKSESQEKKVYEKDNQIPNSLFISGQQKSISSKEADDKFFNQVKEYINQEKEYINQKKGPGTFRK